jgi:hypothetical protein
MLPPAIPRPDTLKGVDGLIRAGFEAYRATCFNWLLVATGLVVAGLIFEGPELWHETTSIVRRWRFIHRFRFSLPEEHTSDWAKLLAFIGWLLIVIGVGGEYVADSFVSKADAYVQTFDEILLTEAQRGTVLARERASAAYERASENEKETADTLKQVEQERADAARSLEVTKGYESQIAQANERAAEAKRDLAEYVAKNAPRRLSGKQTEKLANRLRLLAKRGQVNIAIMYAAFDGEAADFAGDFETAFKAAGWKPVRIGWDQTGKRGLDISMLADPSAPNEIPTSFMPIVQYVHDTITAVGIPCRIAPLSPDEPISLNKPEKGVLYLIVHHKPEIERNR